MQSVWPKDTDETVIRIRNKSCEVSLFIEQYKPFIAACASGVVKRFLYYGEDDELSVALSAFYEAVMAYDKRKGPFLSFSAGVIRRRLIDYLRKTKRHAEGIAAVREEEAQRELDDILAGVRFEQERASEALRLEIEAVEAELAAYGIALEDLTVGSPKHKKLVRAVKRSAALFVSHPALYARFLQSKKLPVKELSQISLLPPKKIECFRKYIIAVSTILSGDYPYLREYVRSGDEPDQ